MEVWQGLTYDSIMGMPTTLRRRLLNKKIELERKREDKHRQQMSQSRSRVRR